MNVDSDTQRVVANGHSIVMPKDKLPPTEQPPTTTHAINLEVLSTPRLLSTSNEASVAKEEKETEAWTIFVAATRAINAWHELGPRLRVILVEAFLLALAMVVVLPWYFTEMAANSTSDGLGNLIASYPNPPITNGIALNVVISTIDPLALTARTQIFVDGLGNFSLESYTGDEADLGLFFFNVFTYQSVLVPWLKENNLTAEPTTTIFQNATLGLYLSNVGRVVLSTGDSLDDAQIGLDQTYKLKAIKPVTFFPLDQYQLKIHARLIMTVRGQFVHTVTKASVYILEFSFPLQVNVYEQSADFRGKGSISARAPPLKEFTGDVSYQTITADVTLARSTAVVGISFFVISLAWLLTIATFSMALDEYFVRPLMMDINPTRVSSQPPSLALAQTNPWGFCPPHVSLRS